MEKIPITPKGHSALETELKLLKSEERPAIIRAIAEAREHGDLSENAEYHSAREKQSFIEEKTWQIVGEHEANIEKGLLNVKSPIARALIGKDAGDSVEVRTPGGEKSYEVLSVNYT